MKKIHLTPRRKDAKKAEEERSRLRLLGLALPWRLGALA
jgi:hypothetical protein